MKYLGTLREDVKRLIQDKDKILESADIDSAIGRAARILSLKTPRVVFEELAGNGSINEWALDTTTWIGGFSRVTVVYFPWDATARPTPPPPLFSLVYSVYEKTAGAFYFRMNAITPGASETLRVYYNTRHAITEAASSLTDATDEDSVALLAAGLCLDIMAVRVIALSGSNISADTVVYQSRQQQYETMSKVYKEQSGLAAFLKTETPKGSMTFVSVGRRTRAADSLS